jgi:hypothetical protein
VEQRGRFKPGQWDASVLLGQLRCAGVIDVGGVKFLTVPKGHHKWLAYADAVATVWRGAVLDGRLQSAAILAAHPAIAKCLVTGAGGSCRGGVAWANRGADLAASGRRRPLGRLRNLTRRAGPRGPPVGPAALA